MAITTKHTREEWQRDFEAQNGRKPSIDEYLEAEQRGVFKVVEVKKSVSERKYKHASPSEKEIQGILSALLEVILEVIFYAATASGAILPFWLTSSHTNFELLNVFGSVSYELWWGRHTSSFHGELSYWPLLFLGPFVFLILGLLSKKFRSSESPGACLFFYLLTLIFALILWVIFPFLANIATNFILRLWGPVGLIFVLVVVLFLYGGHKKK